MCIVLAGALLIAGVVIGAGPRLWRTAEAHDQLPIALPAFQPLSQRSYVYDTADNVISVFERENSQPIKLAQVPPDVVKALLAVEDNEYYIHHGVNVRSFMRALLSNFSSDAPRQGASTVTQQVVKNEFLAGLPRDGRYKALQAHYATMLEKKISKDDILERYLNTVFFGNNAYGLQAAAEVYYGKTVDQLTMIEGAFLAGLVRSPTGYDPFHRPERARARFKQVTDRLVDVGMLTKPQADDLSVNYVLPEIPRTLPTLDTTPTYYSEALRQYLLSDAVFLGPDEQSRANLLYRGGLRIHVTFDPALQQSAEAAQAAMPANAEGFTSSIVSLDTTSGAIRAMVGGTGFVPVTHEVNMALTPRQTGSSIKLFILAAALQAGVEPTDVIDGRRGCVLPNPGDPKDPFIIKGGEAGSVAPLNQQTWLSINCAFARLSQIVGLNRVVDTTYRMARSPYLYIGQPDTKSRPTLQPYPSFATGANPMAPIDMAAGMQTIANQGLHHEPYYVESIDRVDGSRFYTHQDPGTQVLDAGVALTELDILKGVLTRGTARTALRTFDRPAAGKTGTQDDNSNAWFVGATPQLTTAVWVGDPDSYKAMSNIPAFRKDGVSKVQGGTYPARIWRAYMEGQPAALGVLDWPPPPAPVRGAAKLYLPGVECLAQLVSGVPPGASTTTTVKPAAGLLSPSAPPSTTPNAAPPAAPPDESTTTTPATLPPPVYRKLPSGTTIPPDVLDPRAPVPTAPLGVSVYTCGAAPAG
ncbi:MAG: transglycosylase domain-containing protein [Ilumatobacteraceae bacterium]